MSILIKGMEMPKMCDYCKFHEPFLDFAYCDLGEMDMEYKDIANCRHPDCPLIEIPTPHGRLIDIKSVEYGKFTTVGNEYQRWWNGALESVIDNAPTVIEAEGSET